LGKGPITAEEKVEPEIARQELPRILSSAMERAKAA
jgi:hypothetical protein